MKSPLLVALSLTTFCSFSALASTSECTNAERQKNLANNSIALFDTLNGPVKSVIMSSSLPDDGRFKALKGEMQFGQCGELLKNHTSMQEYFENGLETNLLRTAPDNPYEFKYKYQIKNRYLTHSVYMQDIYNRNNKNQLESKTTRYYSNEGELLDTMETQYHYTNGLITSEITQSITPDSDKIATHYTYTDQGKLLKAVEDDKTLFDYQYDKEGKILKQVQYIKGVYDEDKSYETTCIEWDKYNNCLQETLESTIKIDNETVNYSKATLYYTYEYYQ
ncbi:hypothetical protein [Proteus myxofaciens]|uniref:YD repeat-containing protein n=1 Tax=Proteus myxofaciens ATCC 19692 TaxID=1354337 RepID=A0A198GJR4_9GAMM|nr:hypothetical protein [Proteus myxofaciens]OAT37059.1 hypothetical protein M983_0438 [Proteus myxofaciens ATCC 19692]